MKFSLIAILLFAIPAMATPKHILLEAKNTVSLREEFTRSSVNRLKQELIALSQTLPEKEHIRLYLDTPGGEVFPGKELLEVIHGIKNKVDVVVSFAASMGYMTAQGITGERYITPEGILMAHPATVGAEGNLPGSFEVRASFYKNMIGDLSLMAADRTHVSLDTYQKKVRDEYWVIGKEAVKENQADDVVTVECAADLNGTTTETLYTMFGPVGVEWANCPLISEPVSINFDGVRQDLSNQSQVVVFEQIITEGLRNKQSLVSSPALEEQFNRYVR